jgi:hypothetical protein
VTLNVSLRVPDGIVIASDSLSTLTQAINQKLSVTGKCEKCGEITEIKDAQAPPMAVPSSTWPYTQKLFPVQERFGLAIYGWGFVNDRSIYNHMIDLVPKFPREIDSDGDFFGTLSTFIVDYFHGELVSQLKKMELPIDLQPDDWFPFGFQFAGFARDANAEPISRTHLIAIGKKTKVDVYDGIGCTISGDPTVVNMLWEAPSHRLNLASFSLQDAVDYAKFLIRTTSEYQRFSGNMPTVGGEIDVALLTNHRGFQWIAQKELYRMLDSVETRTGTS